VGEKETFQERLLERPPGGGAFVATKKTKAQEKEGALRQTRKHTVPRKHEKKRKPGKIIKKSFLWGSHGEAEGREQQRVRPKRNFLTGKV